VIVDHFSKYILGGSIMFEDFSCDVDVDSTAAEEQGNWPAAGDDKDTSTMRDDSGKDSDMEIE